MKKNYVKECWQGSLEVGSLGRLDKQESLDQLNNGLANLTIGTYINPFTAVNKVRNFIALAGLSCDNITNLPLQSTVGSADATTEVGKLVMPLRHFNGVKGMEKDGKYHEEAASGFALHLHYTKTRGSWFVQAHVVGNEVANAVLGEISETVSHQEKHNELINKGYKATAGVVYVDQKTGQKVRIHGATHQAYQVKEEMDPVRDIASRRGIIGKLKGLARDVHKAYKNRLAAGDAAAKSVRQSMGVEHSPEGKERMLYRKAKGIKENKIEESPKLLLGGKKGNVIHGKLDKVNLIKSISRERVGTVPGTKVIKDKRFNKKPKHKERYDRD